MKKHLQASIAPENPLYTPAKLYYLLLLIIWQVVPKKPVEMINGTASILFTQCKQHRDTN